MTNPSSQHNDAPNNALKEPAPRLIPPTLRPLLGNLPAHTSTATDRSTPTALRRNSIVEHEGPTPTQAVFNLDENDEPSKEDEVDDDEEFESHYSRQSSPASSTESEDEGDGQYIENSTNATAQSMSEVERVSSAPISLPAEQNHALNGTLHASKSTTALLRGPPPLPPPLYPPFYNRPPTPLPPSPSLTSLLRPPSLLNRSTTSTRPTTPDSSDVETPNDTEAAVAHSARRANPLPPTAPKVPTYEYYGFVLYLASSLAFVMYILWSYLPSPFLHALGITYYPNRWWSLAIPAWIVMVLIYIYIALACWNVEYMTLGLERVETMVDEAGSVAILDENGRIRKGGSKRFVTDLEEKKRREAMAHTWDRKKRGGGSARGSKKKEREREEDCYGYTGEITGNGVASGLSWRQVWNEGTDAVMDVPIGGVCEVLYGEGRDIR